MLKFFIASIISLTFLHASDQKDSCAQDMSEMFSSYYKAQTLQRLGETQKALIGYEKSTTSAYMALQSCQDKPVYDYNIMYEFILESEKAIGSIY